MFSGCMVQVLTYLCRFGGFPPGVVLSARSISTAGSAAGAAAEGPGRTTNLLGDGRSSGLVLREGILGG
jgi:hypothetical protein